MRPEYTSFAPAPNATLGAASAHGLPFGAAPAFGSAAGAFGAAPAAPPAFGAAGAFGAAPAAPPAFGVGAAAPDAFGAAPAVAPAFGATPTAGPSFGASVPSAFGLEPASGGFSFGAQPASGTTDSPAAAGGGFTFGKTAASAAGGVFDDAKEKGAVDASAKGASKAGVEDDDGPNLERRDSVGASKLFDFEGGSPTDARPPVPKLCKHLIYLIASRSNLTSRRPYHEPVQTRRRI